MEENSTTKKRNTTSQRQGRGRVGAQAGEALNEIKQKKGAERTGEEKQSTYFPVYPYLREGRRSRNGEGRGRGGGGGNRREGMSERERERDRKGKRQGNKSELLP